MVSAYLTYAYACNASNLLPKYDPSRTAANSSTEEVLIETRFTPSAFTPGTASALTDKIVFLSLSRLINSSTRITFPKIFVAACSFIPDGVNFAAVFPITPPAFKTIASIGSFICSTAFLTEFGSVTSPITISKIFFPVFSSRSFFAASALTRFLQKRRTFFVSFFNANCRAVSFPSPAFAPVIKTLSFIVSIPFRSVISDGGERAGCRLTEFGGGASDDCDRIFYRCLFREW